MNIKLFRKVLVANRGEIACRIIRALKDMSIESVCIYSEEDKHTQAVKMADMSIGIGGRTSRESYLDLDKIIKAIRLSESCAVHPGYGFLSERAEFVERVQKETNAVFIGPSSSAMSLMGDKISAKKLMKKEGVPLVPGSDGPLESVIHLKEIVKELGYPLILKAAAGGGGRGMRVVEKDEDLSRSFDLCQKEAFNYFGNKDIFCERYIKTPRHIEIQVLFDRYGKGIHLFERDCSIQRRHQKVFEEAPSSYLTEENRRKLGSYAVKAASVCGYEGAGTVEFICESPEKAYFMEMNTRIQVEHPVTEMITGIDLIKSQIDIAQGKPLPWTQDHISFRGWSMEARINAENKEFLPQIGIVKKLNIPQGPFVRIDTHLYQGYKMTDAYDSMIAKIISYGSTREEARLRLLRALDEFELEGFDTTKDFHKLLLKNDDFIESNFSTNFLETHHLWKNQNEESSLNDYLYVVCKKEKDLFEKKVFPCIGI